VTGLIGLGEVAGNNSSGQTITAGLSYSRDKLYFGTGYVANKCKAVSGCTPTQDDNKVVGIGGSYDFNVAKVSSFYTSQTGARNVRNNDANVFSVIVQVPVGAWMLSGGYSKLDDKSALDQNIKQFNLGAIYSISKRTDGYALYSRQNVDNGGKASMALYTSSDDSQNVFGFGIRHKF
jgi:predicted porin